MEPGSSIDSGSVIRVTVLPVGGAIPPALLRHYFALLGRHARVPLASLRPFYTEHQKSPFAHQPWDAGALRLRFVLGGCPPSPWEDFQSHRKVLAVVGICHCPSSPDLDAVADEFAAAALGYPAALASRCFAFSPAPGQVVDKTREDMVCIIPSDQETQEQLILTMIQGLAASLLMEFEKWVLRAESTGTPLKTPLDSQSFLGSEEVIKAKKRRLGRAQKIIGDYCLLAGSPVDANAHYSTAIELARLTQDVFWHAGALEGSACALLVDQTSPKDSTLEQEIKYNYYSIIQLYRRATLQDSAQRVSTVSFELEAELKLAKYLCRRELAKEVADLLMGAADGAKHLIDASDRLILYIEIARLFGTLGYQRKAAFFTRQVAQLYLQQDSPGAAMSAMQVLMSTANAYHILSRTGTAKKLNSSTKEGGGSGTSNVTGKVHPQFIASLFESHWSTLQMVVLREILMSSVRAGDPLTAWSAAARLLRSFYPLITPAGQSGLASSLTNSAERIPSGTYCLDPCLPFIRLHSIPSHLSQADIVKRDPQKKEWWTGAGPSGPFIYTPFSKGSTATTKPELTWVIGEPVQVLVELANPCSFELIIESIYLSAHSGNFDAFPVSVRLPPITSKVIVLSGIPTKVGPVLIPGCFVHCFGVITEHLFKEVDYLLLGAQQGLVLSDPFRSCGSSKLKNVIFPDVTVLPTLPLLVHHVMGGEGATVLHEGEIRDVWITLRNAGTVPVEEANVAVSGKNIDCVISVAHHAWKSALPLKPGGEVTFSVTLKAWPLTLVDPEIDGSRSPGSRSISKEGLGPFLDIHYAGALTNDDSTVDDSVPPGRRLVVPLNICVVPGLRLVRARMLSMKVPAQFNRLHSKSATFNKSSTKMVEKIHQNVGLLKMDPSSESWGLRLLELDVSNPTDVVFDVDVLIHPDGLNGEEEHASNHESSNTAYHKTRIDRDYSARVLIPLEHFKLPVLDSSLFLKNGDEGHSVGKKLPGTIERNVKAELNACISSLISNIKVRWHSGRNSFGELNIKDAVQNALQESIMDVLLPDPLTIGFKFTKDGILSGNRNQSVDDDIHETSPIFAHEMTPIELFVKNNTMQSIRMSINILCKDVAGESCLEESNGTVVWAGCLADVHSEVPPLQEVAHSFALYFLVPGDYFLQASATIVDVNHLLRARAHMGSSDDPIFCHGTPFHIRVAGAA